ncbi:MAG: aspartate--tRNA ligase [Phycisphaerales bacterium]|nr:MAG: aspartate--tRNA ligase [Phycisphaerales bacterium]
MLQRTHACGELRLDHAGQTVNLAGWVNNYRDHGTGLVFIDLRDHSGLVQLVFDKHDVPEELVRAADRLRAEDVVAVRGTVRKRDGGPNPKLPTGQVEVVVERLDVLAKADTPPFQPGDEQNLPGEELRLRHRYLDLRRPRMQQILRTRHRVAKLARDFFDALGFIEVETPNLCRSTPEGARDFLVPSRLQPGSFYALPQSPQLFKQILMVAGVDRYMQICRCFRDEDPRADRQAEFSQIDLEMAFVTREDVLNTMEAFARSLWKEVLGVEVPRFPRMTWADAMDRYGTDRPDLRFGLELVDISDLAARTDFQVFQQALSINPGSGHPATRDGGVVKAFRVPGGAERLTRKITDGYAQFVRQFGAGGAPVAKVTQAGLETGIARFLEPVAGPLRERLGLEPGDTVVFGADRYSVCSKALGELRIKVAQDMGLIQPGLWAFLWVVDFPMFEYDEQSGRYHALHHPFTAPRADQVQRFLDADVNERQTILGILSDGYDMVLNGSEIGGGSIRIHRTDVQQKVFELLGMDRQQAKAKFGFLLEALRYGAPPHGGIAFGLDRLVMHLVGTENIRDVMAFPKTQNGADLLTQAPAPVDPEQLDELHIRLVEPAQTTAKPTAKP